MNIDDKSQELTFFLTKAEATKGARQFFQFVTQASELDPKNFAKFGISLFDSPFVLILGQHALARAHSRCFMSEYQLKEKVMRQLANPLVAARILYNQIFLDDDNKIQSVNDVTAQSTVVVEAPYVFVYEAGFSYVRVKTIWDLRMGHFILRPEYDTYIELKDGEFIERAREEHITL